MKASMFLALLALTAALTSAHARPPFPPSTASSAQPKVILCKDLNALTEEEIEELNNDVEKIVSVDLDLREVCFRVN